MSGEESHSSVCLKTLGGRLKVARERQRLSQAELARLLNVHKNTIGLYEKDRREPPVRVLTALHRVLRVNPAWLLDLGGPPPPGIEPTEYGVAEHDGPAPSADRNDEPVPAGSSPQSSLTAEREGTLDEVAELRRAVQPPHEANATEPAPSFLPPPAATDGDEIVFIRSHEPVDIRSFAMVPKAETVLSAGGGAVVMSERVGEPHAFRLAWLNQRVTSVKNLVLMDVEGDSMLPTFKAGDTVLVDKGQRRILPGDIYAMRMDNSLVVKRLNILPNGRVRVISDNKELYPPETVYADEVHVIGRVIWFARSLV